MSELNQRGTILMIALWILAILMLLSVSLAYRTRMEIRLSSSISKRMKAGEMAREGIEILVRILKKDETPYDYLYEVKSMAEQANGQCVLRYGEGAITCNMMDEERKINLTASSLDVIRCIPGIGEETASSIIDWQDDEEPPEVTLPGGAEELYYIGLMPSYHCKNKSLESIEELLAVKGVTPDLVQAIKPLATVYGHGRLNINTASGEVLEAFFSGLGYSDPGALTDKIILYRHGLDGIEGTEDDNAFETIDSVKDMPPPCDLTLDEKNFIDANKTRMDVKSSCYRVSLNAVYEGKYNSNTEVVFSKTDSGTIKIIYWQGK